jgi:hypothetical protein
MSSVVIDFLKSLNELLTAGIAITAFSLLLYALSFNLRDRVARSFAFILACVVLVFVCDAIGSVSNSPVELEFWLRLQWVGIVLLPPAYIHFSDALLATTGRPSRGRRRMVVRLSYVVSLVFLAMLPLSLLVGPLMQSEVPAPHLERTLITWVFTLYYVGVMLLAGANFLRSYRRTVTSASRRRMGYLLVGSLAPALGSFPYMLFGSEIAVQHQFVFWLMVTLSNLLVSVLLVIMAYSVAFFGVSWPDRVVKRRLFKWLMRGPVTASLVLGITTAVRRAGESVGLAYSAAVPIIMVASLLIMEHMITLAAPLWERWLFHGGDRDDIELLQNLEERLLTTGDLHQFLESVLAAVCDRLQTSAAFVAAFGRNGMEMVVTIGENKLLEKEDLSEKLLEQVNHNGSGDGLFSWGEYWLVPLFKQRDENQDFLGLLGMLREPEQTIDEEQNEALTILAGRAAMALEDRLTQQQVFTSLQALRPEVELIQSLRAATSYRGGGSVSEVLTSSIAPEIGQETLSRWVKDALTHYWGGPRLTESPLLKLRVVQQAMDEHEGNPTNALRAILRQAIEHVRPEGERRFTGEWILYNILELKFLEGKKVREVALRLAMSEADLYRKQRVAIEAVADAIIEMEKEAVEHSPVAIEMEPVHANHNPTRWA